MGNNDTKTIDDVFDRMDQWRHLPNYQLERRADLFFSLYLAEALEDRLDFPIHPEIIPEFPLRIGSIKAHLPDEHFENDNHSFKIDYLAFSADLKTPIFVELKTDRMSVRKEQAKRMDAARKVGFQALLEGAKLLFKHTKDNRKYYHLFASLEQLGQVAIPPKMKEIVARQHLQGINPTIELINNRKGEWKEPIVVFVLPVEDKNIEIPCKQITFEDFLGAVGKCPDPMSKRFALSLAEWTKLPAGKLAPRS